MVWRALHYLHLFPLCCFSDCLLFLFYSALAVFFIFLMVDTLNLRSFAHTAWNNLPADVYGIHYLTCFESAQKLPSQWGLFWPTYLVITCIHRIPVSFSLLFTHFTVLFIWFFVCLPALQCKLHICFFHLTLFVRTFNVGYGYETFSLWCILWYEYMNNMSS